MVMRDIRAHLVYGVSACSLALIAAPAMATGTLAGTPIENTASASYDGPGGTSVSVDSNRVELIVDEILDIAVASNDAGDVGVSPGEADAILSFTVTNGGNGPEPAVLSANLGIGGDDFDPTAASIHIDSNNNGAYDAGVDTAYNAASPPDLDPDASITVFILGDIPGSTVDGDRSEVALIATAKTGSGTPGTVFAGAGEGGSNAVVGATGATDNDSGFYAVSAAIIALTKSAAVVDPFGGATQVPGSIITYSLVASVTGSGSLPNVAISDSVPTGTSYVGGSITLDGSGLTDSAGDADGGSFDGSAIRVALGSVAAGITKTITFQVEID